VSSQLTNRNQGARAASYNAATVVRLWVLFLEATKLPP
jgi:hypothetical protein